MSDVHAYIPTEELADIESFEVGRRAAFEGDPAERTTRLEGLLASTQTLDGHTVLQLALEQTEAETAAADSAERLARVQAVSSRVLDVIVDSESQGLKGVFERVVLPEDTEATERATNLQKRLPSGPKQNRTSIRVSPKSVVPRH